MKMAREGIPFLLAAVLPFLVTAGIAYFGDSRMWMVVALGLGLVSLFIGFFFRNPDRHSGAAAEVVLAAADGRIVGIEETSEPFMGGPCRRISTFLSIFNVHVQRAPVAGVVGDRTYDPGKYLAAWEPKASTENERAALGISTDGGPVLVRQIAGLVARRIVTDPEVGDELIRGDRIGLIRFGSRVDLFVPLEWDVLCTVGDRVRAGESALVTRSVSVGTDGDRTPADEGNP